MTIILLYNNVNFDSIFTILCIFDPTPLVAVMLLVPSRLRFRGFFFAKNERIFFNRWI